MALTRSRWGFRRTAEWLRDTDESPDAAAARAEAPATDRPPEAGHACHGFPGIRGEGAPAGAASLSRLCRDQGLLPPFLPQHLHHRMEQLALADARPHPQSEELARIFRLSEDERSAVERHEGALPVGITPYYASLMSLTDAREPLRRTHIMTGDEYVRLPGEDDDPLGEDHDTVAPGLVHRYPRPGPVPDHRHLLDLLPLLHARPRRRQSRRRVPVLDPPVGKGARLSGGPQRGPRRAALGRRPADLGGRQAGLAARTAQGHQAHRIHPHRHQDADGQRPAHHQEPGPDPQEASSAVDEPAFHPSSGADAGGDRGDGAAGRCRHPAGQPDGAAQGHQRQRRGDGASDARPAEAPGEAVLSLSMRSHPGLGPFPHAGEQGPGDHRRAARPHHGLRDADLRGRCAGRRRQDPVAPDPVVGRDGDDLLLRNFEGKVYRYPDPGGELGRNKGA